MDPDLFLSSFLMLSLRCQFRSSGVNFISILHAAFTLEDRSKSTKRQLRHKYLFALLGSSRVKAEHEMLMKLTPGGVNFTNVLCAAFMLVGPKSVK
jgi:hypothetical protein